MKLILSNRLQNNFMDFTVIKSFKELKDLLSTPDFECEVLVINEFNENFFEASMVITSFSKAKPDVLYLYIAENPNKELANVMIGLNVTTLRETFYLDNESELNALVEDLQGTKETGIVANSNLKIIESFLGYVDADSPRAKVPIIRSQAKKAMDELSVLVSKQQQDLNEMGSTALALCKKSQDIISKLAKGNSDVHAKLDKLQKMTAGMQSTQQGISQGIVNFPEFRYAGSTRVIVFKEYSPCRYLTSFVLGYANYLRFMNNKKVKVVIAHQKGKCLSQKYDSFTTISQESVSMESLYFEDQIATNIPKKEVLKKLLDSGMDVVIVVDRLYNDYDIVTGKTTRFNAVNGISDIRRFNLKSSDTIFTSINVPDAFYCIPTVSNYSVNVDARKAVYAQQCKDCYERINQVAKLL